MSERQEKVASLIQEMAAQFIREESNTDPLITVTRATISPDLKRTSIYFTAYPEAKEGDAHIFLKRKAGEFRTFLKKHGAFKVIPHIEFERDCGEHNRQRIDEIANDT